MPDFQKQRDRIQHIFDYINYENLNKQQQSLVDSYTEWFEDHETLTDRQLEVLEDIFRNSA